MIVGVTGMIGHGKTYRAVRQAVDLAVMRRAVLAANIRVNLPASAVRAGVTFVQLPVSEDGLDVPYLMDLVDRCREGGRGIVVLVDEVGIIMPARWWSKFPIRFLFLLSQSRKMRCDLIWTAQAPDQADKVLRDLTEYTDKVRAMPAPSLRRREEGKRPWVFRWTRWRGVKVDMTGQRVDECIDKGYERYRRETETLYDTDEIIAPPDRLLADSADRSVSSRSGRSAGGQRKGTGESDHVTRRAQARVRSEGAAAPLTWAGSSVVAPESDAPLAGPDADTAGQGTAARKPASAGEHGRALAAWRNRPAIGSSAAAASGQRPPAAGSLDQRT